MRAFGGLHRRAQQSLLDGVNWLLLTGDVAQARTFADEVGGFPPGPLRDSVLGFLARAHGDPVVAEELLSRAWERCAPVVWCAGRRGPSHGCVVERDVSR